MGDLGQKLSYNCTGSLGFTKMPMELMGDDYVIGEWLYTPKANETLTRTISTYRNNSYLPYTYSKFWDGSCYFFSVFLHPDLKAGLFLLPLVLP